ncbi:phage/plasmid primase, P4 family [Aquincola sp. J276]|uniref:DNA primase family protein n=1 Tax=Aquincola sp. J276 TaxID=2898432 RepID=UPI002151771D|nr:phage/plasmid primase, P4 family [Aquincola sp. J276]MCR5865669.1 phage/plasmid primase, P4 family [Aquincola sp. J276]
MDKLQALRTRLLAEVESCVDRDALLLAAWELNRQTLAPEYYSLRMDVMHEFKVTYKKLTGRTMFKAELEGLFPPPKAKKSKTLEQLPLTEFGVTERMLQLHGKEVAYAGDSGRWYLYREGHWQEQPKEGVQLVQMARNIIKTLRPLAESIVDPELQEEALRSVAACERTGFAVGVVNGLAGEDGVLSESLDFNTKPEFLNARNGLIDLRTGQLLPHDPTVRATMVTGCDYVLGATRPWFERTMLEAFNGCAETVSFLKRFMGYSVMGVPKERYMLMALGKGKDGKSTIFNAIKEALGSHAATMNSSVIASPVGAQAHADAGAPAEHLLRLRGKRLILGSEVKRSSVFIDDAVKTLASGGDTILARGLWSANSVEFKPSGVLVNPANVIPLIRDDDPAVIDRLLLLRFAGQLRKDGAKVDTGRSAKLAAEMEGILAWLVEGALEYQQRGLDIPEAVHRVKAEILEGTSPISRFIEDCCELGPKCAATTKELWEAWRVHSFEQGEKHLAQSEISFGRAISASIGIEGDRATVDGKQQRIWVGIRLKSSRTRLSPGFFQRRVRGV